MFLPRQVVELRAPNRYCAALKTITPGWSAAVRFPVFGSMATAASVPRLSAVSRQRKQGKPAFSSGNRSIVRARNGD